MAPLRRRIAAVLAAGTLSAGALAGCTGTGAGAGPAGGAVTSTATGATAGRSSAGSGTASAANSTTSADSSSALSPSSTAPSGTSTSTTTRPTTAKPTTTKPTTTKPTTTKPTPPPVTDTSTMTIGAQGPAVQRMQQRLSDLGYWLGTPDGEYGYQTSQAVMALQKTAGLGRDGVYGPATRAALDKGMRPRLHVSGNAVQINLATQVLTIVENGAIVTILNTSTGSGQQYVNEGETRTAITPRGTFSVIFQIDGLDRGPLGDLWRPKYFVGGIAVHGSASVPGYPASHGCARVSNAAMDMIWARGLMPMGRTVVVL